MAEIPTRVLGDGTSVPVLGFGTYPLRGDDGVRAIASALEVGYRLIDTAVNYRNEREVTEAIRVSGVDRGDVFVQTKVPGRDHENARTSIETSLQVMDLEYLDSVLIHWPNPSQGHYVEAWQGLIDAREAGLVRSIGVSNFTPAHLDEIIEATGVTPASNQVEMHPAFPQEEQRAADAERGITTQAWSPIGRGEILDAEPVVAAAAVQKVILTQRLELGLVQELEYTGGASVLGCGCRDLRQLDIVFVELLLHHLFQHAQRE